MDNQALLDIWLTRLHRKNWNALNPSQRLRMLQQLEIIMAMKQGRKACRVYAFPAAYQEKNPNVLGMFDGQAIFIHHEYIEKTDQSAFVNGRYSVAEAINVVLHEGRHALQHHMVDHGAANVDETQRAKMAFNFRAYVRNGPQYGAQIIELDARRYARQEYQRLMDRMRLLGWEPEQVFLDQQKFDRRQEMIRAINLKNYVTEKDLDDYVALKWRTFGKAVSAAFPGVDLQSADIFEEARKLLRGEISEDEFVDGTDLAFTDAADFQISVKADAAVPSFEDVFWRTLGKPVDRAREKEKTDDLRIKPIGAGKIL